jgi:hypothetical protein
MEIEATAAGKEVLSNNSHIIPHTPYEYYMPERYRTKPSVKKTIEPETKYQVPGTQYHG